MQATQDKHLVRYAHEYRTELHEEWLMFEEVLRSYPEVFPPSKVSQKLFYKFYA